MAQSKFIYLGVKGSVIALNSATGEELWTKHLKSSDFVNVVLDGGNLFATTSGEIFCLDPHNGTIRWHNPLKGYGWGLVTIAGEGFSENTSVLAEQKRRRDQETSSTNSAASASAS